MVTARNSLDKLTAGVSTRANLLTYFNSNLDIIDAAIAKCNFVAASDPTANDDSGDGYSAGSQWYNTTGHKVFVCENATSGSAIWRQIYPLTAGDLSGPAGATDGNIPLFDGATGKLLKNSAYSPASFAVAAKGVTNGDSHDHNGGDGAAIVAAATSFGATAKVLGRKTAGAGAGEECSITEILDLLGTAERGDVLYRGASAWAMLPHGVAGQVLTRRKWSRPLMERCQRERVFLDGGNKFHRHSAEHLHANNDSRSHRHYLSGLSGEIHHWRGGVLWHSDGDNF